MKTRIHPKLIVIYLIVGLLFTACSHQSHVKGGEIIVGAQRLDLYLPLLTGKKVALVVNQTSRVKNNHLVDLLQQRGVDIRFIFAPEHGFRGDHDAGEKVSNSIDTKTGIPLVSIYGKHKKPSDEIMAELDIIIFDIQDVGVRFYTYISSMHYMMEAASNAEVGFIVLDRPNPNGMYVDGPVLEPEFSSFVGMHPIPLVHGLTVGELAKMIIGQGWLKTQNELNLTVIPIKNYSHNKHYSLPVKPSPNLPNDLSIALYSSLGFFEATPVSIGRGTSYPFQVIGHNAISIGEYQFTPISTPGAAVKPKLMDTQLTGTRLLSVSKIGINLEYILAWHKKFSLQNQLFFSRAKFMDKLAGTDKLRIAIEQGQTEAQIRQSWQSGLDDFIDKRKPYLLYEDIIK
jgi:uncharacterized protein YbbC (DUF1343 family)